nr:Chain B, PEPTIDE1HAJ_B Chain B, PEPTIDE
WRYYESSLEPYPD